MSSFVTVAPEDFRINPFDAIGRRGMLITATKKDGSFNTMTASWGTLGVLWNKPVCTIYIRPQRYTYEFAEAGDAITLSFFDHTFDDALRFCGTKSGRDVDKIAHCGLAPCKTKNGGVYFLEASHVIIARKLYADSLKEELFLHSEPLSHYPKKDYHRTYICEIGQILTKISS